MYKVACVLDYVNHPHDEESDDVQADIPGIVTDVIWVHFGKQMADVSLMLRSNWDQQICNIGCTTWSQWL